MSTRAKWRIGGAFGLAVLVHLVAVSLGAFRYLQPAEIIVGAAPGAVEVMIRAAFADESVPPPEIHPPAPPPPPLEEYLFTEARETPPPARQNVAQPIAQVRRGRSGSASFSSALALALNAPLPEYPSAARENRITGDGIAVMTVDRNRGSVTHVSMWKSTGNSSLDDAALRSFRRWRFKPGSVSKVKAPVTFRLTAQLD